LVNVASRVVILYITLLDLVLGFLSNCRNRSLSILLCLKTRLEVTLIILFMDFIVKIDIFAILERLNRSRVDVLVHPISFLNLGKFIFLITRIGVGSIVFLNIFIGISSKESLIWTRLGRAVSLIKLRL